MYFTYTQRISSSPTRTCISRQGHVRICSHACLNWSDIEKVSSKTLSIESGRNSRNGHPVQLKVETTGVANGTKSIKVTIHTSWHMFQQTSLMTGTLKLPSPKKILETVATSAKDEAASGLCPHASLNPAKWQMQLHPQHKREPCDISPNQETVSKHFFGQRASGAESPFEHLCPLCEMTRRNDAPAIKSQSPQATHHDSCRQCGARYNWTWYSSRSFGHSFDSLKLSITRQFTVTKPTDAEWLKNLEITPGGPADPRGDPATKHLLWCDNELGTWANWSTVAWWAESWPWP